MELEEIREHLSAVHKGRHTLQGFLNKTIIQDIVLSEAPSVYLFPGTLQLDDSVVCYMPKTDSFHCFSLQDLKVLKPVPVYLEKTEEANNYSASAIRLATCFQDYLDNLSNKYLRNALMHLLISLTAKKRLTSEQYNAAMFLLKRLRLEFPSDVLPYLENIIRSYYRLCVKVSEQNEEQRLVATYQKLFKNVTMLDGLEVEIAKKQFKRLFESKQININEVRSFGKAKVVLQLLYLVEVLEDKRYLLFDEIVNSFKVLRQDLTVYFSESLLKKAIQVGLDKLVTDGFVEANPLQTYCLTEEGQTVARHLTGIDYENTNSL